MDGDGAVDRLDVVGSGVDLALGDGTGGFSVPLPVPGDPPGDVINDATLADLDADGDLDLVTAGSGGGRFRLNDGTGRIGPLDIPGIPSGAASTGYVPFVGETAHAIDLDADDDLDITWTGYCDKPDRDVPYYGIAFNDGPATFTFGVQGGLALWVRRVDLAYADVDEDGRLDRIVGDPDSPSSRSPSAATPMRRVRPRPTSSCRYPPPRRSSVGSPPTSMATATSTSWSQLRAAAPPPSSTATERARFPTDTRCGAGGTSIERVDAADLDGDGRTDLIFGTPNAGTGGSRRSPPLDRLGPGALRARSPRLRGGCEARPPALTSIGPFTATVQEGDVPATIVVGTQWGDEGKGKFTDLFAKEMHLVVRYQGGHNAGHTLVVDGETFALQLIPSGVLYDHIVPVIGNGVMVDPQVLLDEIDMLERRGRSCSG